MSDDLKSTASDEGSLIKEYRDLTGANESTARSVFMYVCCREVEEGNLNDSQQLQLFGETAPSVVAPPKDDSEHLESIS